MDNRMLRAAAIAGVIMGVLSGVPCIQAGNCLACLYLWGSGAFAVWFYQRSAGPASAVTAAQGITIGAAAGAIGAVVFEVLRICDDLVGINRAILERVAADQLPRGGAVLRQFFDSSLAPGRLCISLAVSIVLFAVIAALGGALGASLFGKPKAAPYPPAPPPPAAQP